MTDAGINGELYPFTFWISEEDYRRLTRIMEKTGVTSEDVVIRAALRNLEGDLNCYGTCVIKEADMIDDGK